MNVILIINHYIFLRTKFSFFIGINIFVIILFFLFFDFFIYYKYIINSVRMVYTISITSYSYYCFNIKQDQNKKII